MTGKKKDLTVNDILSEDNKRKIADLLVAGEVDNIVVFYRKGKVLYHGTTIDNWPELIGTVELGEQMLIEEWNNAPLPEGDGGE